MIYFIRDSLTSHIKIGFTDKLLSRLSKMRTDCPGELEVLLLIEGSIKDEHAIHAELRAFRARGEWFRPDQPVLALVERRRPDAIEHASESLRKGCSHEYIASLTGFSRPYISMLSRGFRSNAAALAVVYGKTGIAIGPLAQFTASDLEIWARITNTLAAATPEEREAA